MLVNFSMCVFYNIIINNKSFFIRFKILSQIYIFKCYKLFIQFTKPVSENNGYEKMSPCHAKLNQLNLS